MDLERYNSYVLMKFEEHCRQSASLKWAYLSFYRQLQQALADAVEWQKMVETIRKPEE